jgi:hyperosmotically inducible protein
MNIKLSIAALVLGGCLLPVAAYSADTTKSAVPANVNETPGAGIKDNGRADPAHRSAHPVDDSWITTKVKAKIVEDKQTRADHVDVETVNGVVDLTGTARSKATACAPCHARAPGARRESRSRTTSRSSRRTPPLPATKIRISRAPPLENPTSRPRTRRSRPR